MGKQDVFKGALGWDDWIWWSGIGALGLFFLLVILCCIVCVQRAKRKGRDEAMAVVQARERERQQQEQAQLRYAQAQQVRYPAREPSYKFSKPEPPQASYNPYGHDDHQMHRNSYVQPPQPRPKPRRGSQFPPPTVDLDQQQSPAQQPPQALYAAVPARQSPASPPAPIQPSQPEELPQVAAYYGRKTNQEAPPIHSAPIVSQQYQRQQQVNPNQPPLMQYRRHSGRGTFNNGDDQSATTLSDVPFVQVNSPRTSNASTVSTTISSSVPAGGLYSFNQQRPGAGSTTSSFGRQSVTGGTLRDRIDALREGTPQDISRLTATAMSSGTNGSGSVSSSFTTSSLDNRYSSAPPPPQRLSQIASGTVLSDSSYATDDVGFDENAFDTARSSQVLNLPRPDSEGSIGSGDVDLSGQFEDAESPPHDRESYPSPPRRGRAGTNDSDGSIEF